MRARYRVPTERQRRILARAAKTRDGRVQPRADEDLRLYMYALGRMSKKQFIYREAGRAFITDVGRAAVIASAARKVCLSPRAAPPLPA